MISSFEPGWMHVQQVAPSSAGGDRKLEYKGGKDKDKKKGKGKR